MVINVSHSSDNAISQAIDVSDAPVIATHHGLRSVNNIPRNMPDWLLKKLAAKGGIIGFQIGSEFSDLKEYAYITAHRHKTFWDTTDIPDLVKGKTLYEVDRLVAPQFPMPGADVPDSIMMTVDNWVAVVDRAIQMVGEDHVAIGTDFDGGPTLARGMRDVRDLPMITDAMLRRGYSEERIDKFWGARLMRKCVVWFGSGQRGCRARSPRLMQRLACASNRCGVTKPVREQLARNTIPGQKSKGGF
jgi:membrane dipeptidase